MPDATEQRHRKPGRNDPCSCGSGKKYKHCCLASERQRSESPDEIAWRRARRVIGDVPRLLSGFIADVYSTETIEQAWDEFTVWEGYAFDPEAPLMALFMPWLYHRWEPDPHEEPPLVDASLRDRPPTSVFLERRGARLDPLLQRYLEACLEAPFSFHEILRCDAGHGLRTRDVLTGAEHEVREATASQSLEIGDVLYGLLVPIDGVVILEACSPYVLSPADKIAIIELREQFETRPYSAPRFKEELRDYDTEVREVYIGLIRRMLDPQPPVLHNSDGELFVMHRIDFDVDDAERALAALAQAVSEAAEAEVVRAPDGRLERARFPWMKPGNRPRSGFENTVLGHIELTPDRIVAHANSAERAVRLREVLERALGATARLRSIEVIDPADLDSELEPPAGEDDAAEDLSALPEVREHLSRMYQEHYDDWVTQPLPALGGRKPIDVVREPNGREKVEALVADFERHAARTPDGLSDAALVRLRERLGLPRTTHDD